MSWKFPKHRPLNTDVMDTRDINETLLSFVDEASGELNEHNFLGGMLTDGAEYADDAGISVTHFHQADDPSWVSSPSVQNYPTVRMEVHESWMPLTFIPNIGPTPPQMEITFTTNGGPIWLISSFQAQLSSPTHPFTDAIGYCFALSVDGSILYESLFGGGDSNDEIQSLAGGLGTTMGPATNGMFIPIKLEAYVNLAPGTYEVRVEYRTLKSFNGTNPGLVGIFSRELMAIELAR